jgi:glycine cleavage system H protein
MSKLPENLHYANTHEWAKLEDNQLVKVGITEFAQSELGDLVFIQLPEVGRKLAAGEQCAVVESVKTASDLHAPVSGEVVAVNEAVLDAPQWVNDEPYETWLFCIKTRDVTELNQLMKAAAYQAMIEA